MLERSSATHPHQRCFLNHQLTGWHLLQAQTRVAVQRWQVFSKSCSKFRPSCGSDILLATTVLLYVHSVLLGTKSIVLHVHWDRHSLPQKSWSKSEADFLCQFCIPLNVLKRNPPKRDWSGFCRDFLTRFLKCYVYRWPVVWLYSLYNSWVLTPLDMPAYFLCSNFRFCFWKICLFLKSWLLILK